MQKGSAPDYQNIRNTYKQAQDSIRAHLEFFEKDKERIVIVFLLRGKSTRK